MNQPAKQENRGGMRFGAKGGGPWTGFFVCWCWPFFFRNVTTLLLQHVSSSPTNSGNPPANIANSLSNLIQAEGGTFQAGGVARPSQIQQQFQQKKP